MSTSIHLLWIRHWIHSVAAEQREKRKKIIESSLSKRHRKRKSISYLSAFQRLLRACVLLSCYLEVS